jgi:hypothetical protein
MLTRQQVQLLEDCWELLDRLRNCRDFNETHDVTLGDVCMGLSEFLDWQHERERSSQQSISPVHVATLESFRNL